MKTKIKPSAILEGEALEKAIASATKVGVADIDDVIYKLLKVESKNKSQRVPDSGEIITGRVNYIGNSDKAWLFVVGDSPVFGREGWFRTSPVQSVTTISNGYVVETENSVYELVRQ